MNVEVPCQRRLNIINRLLHVYCLVSGGGRAGQVCRPDAVSFPQASATGAGSSSQRFCGSKLSAVDGTALGNQQIITYQTPFRLFSELSYPMEYVHQIMSLFF